jgi:hypothetical protein
MQDSSVALRTTYLISIRILVRCHFKSAIVQQFVGKKYYELYHVKANINE